MKKYCQLRLEERKELYLLKKEDYTLSQISEKLSRSKSTLLRELKRNTADQRIGYLPDEAQGLASTRKVRHGPKINRFSELKIIIIKHLTEDKWSPEMIAGRMKLEGLSHSVSCETIYEFVHSKEGVFLGLPALLAHRKPKRGPRQGRKKRKILIPDRTSIHKRPQKIETREEFGHYEGDLTFFDGSQKTNIAVVVERKTRYAQLIKNENKQTTTIIKGIFNKLIQKGKSSCKSITFDNGLEFARHTFLKKLLKIDTYFCDPHSPWQKGQVERTNATLHRFLPKKSSLKDVTHQQIQRIQDMLNNLPRKCLGFKTPTEAFNQELSQIVALRT